MLRNSVLFLIKKIILALRHYRRLVVFCLNKTITQITKIERITETLCIIVFLYEIVSV